MKKNTSTTTSPEQIYLSIIIPAYNEAKRLPLTLIDIDKHMERAPFSYEIIVVDNNSKDATREIAERFALSIPHLKVIECAIQGKGAAVAMGMKQARGSYRLFTDADNSTAITHFFSMEHYLKEGFDVVIGSRDVEGSQMQPSQPWYRRILGNMGNLFIQAVLLPGIKDTQCGFKIFSREAAQAIFNQSTVYGWGFDVEALALAKAMGYRIKEAPVVWVNDPSSHVGASAYIQVLLEVIKIRWALMRKQYVIERESESE